MSDRQFDFMKGLLIGGLIGVAVGVLYAPKSGKETREDIARKAEELMDKAKEEYERAVQTSKRAYEAAREKQGFIEGRIQESSAVEVGCGKDGLVFGAVAAPSGAST